MAKNLLIVESPAKAKTIEKYLGKEFKVMSSIGHIRDLPSNGIGVDVKNHFTPEYIVSPDKIKVVKELKKNANAAETVWLATDEDREGEAIAWHLFKELGLEEQNTKRVVYHEITKSAIEEAIHNPRNINLDLVNAQQARRVLDRLVGYELSPILWRKIKPSLSAGRVQSVAVRLIVEREREITTFNVNSFFKITGYFISGGIRFKAELDKRFKTEQEAKDFLTKITGAEYMVRNLEKKPSRRSPSPPFITSTLQQEASRKLSFSVAQTMRVAQSLYEKGDITYMRTDSVNLSQFALDAARNEVEKLYGDNYVKTRNYKTKSSSAQEAHEAIRPTDFTSKEIEGDYNEKRLYDLIRKRTLASQMTDAEIEKTIITIGIVPNSGSKVHVSFEMEAGAQYTNLNFIAEGEVITFDGFLKVYSESEDDINAEDEKEANLPQVQVNQKLDNDEVTAIQRFTQPLPRYTEASLVKKLEALGIGRPSTYAPTISTIQKRGYVTKESKEGVQRNYTVLSLKNGEIKQTIKSENTGAEKAKLFPTDIGMVVNDFLLEQFPEILDFNFTAKVEDEFDIIAEGKLSWTDMLEKFYAPFHSNVEKTSAIKERKSGERLIGKDENGNNVYVKIGRFGPMVQIGETGAEEKPRFSKLRGEQRMDSMTLEEALGLFKLPRKAGIYEDKDINVGIGRFGPYIRHDNKFYSLSAMDDPNTISEARAIEVIEEKRNKDKDSIIQTFEHTPEIKIIKGRYGPYLSMDNNMYRIPKSTDAKAMTLEDCLVIIKDEKSLIQRRKGFKAGKKKK